MGYNRAAPKRPVNMTLNEDLVRRVRGLSTNLSETVENLLADFVEAAEAKAMERERQIAAYNAASDAFAAKHGSLADEFDGPVMPDQLSAHLSPGRDKRDPVRRGGSVEPIPGLWPAGCRASVGCGDIRGSGQRYLPQVPDRGPGRCPRPAADHERAPWRAGSGGRVAGRRGRSCDARPGHPAEPRMAMTG